MKNYIQHAKFMLLTTLLFLTVFDLGLTSVTSIKRRAFQSEQTDDYAIFNDETKISKSSDIFDGLGLSVEKCTPNSPGFLSFLGITRAILQKEGEIAEATGFCFKKLEYSYKMTSETSLQLKITSTEANSYTCSDVHFYSVGTRWDWGNTFWSGDKQIKFDNLTKLDLDVIKARGVQVYEMCDSASNILPDMIKTFKVFFDAVMDKGDHPSAPYDFVKQANIDMVKEISGYEWKNRDKKKMYFPDKSLIKSGDTFQLMSFKGMGPILEYGTGGRSAHIVMAIWDTNQKTGKEELYIAESRPGGDWPSEGIQRNLFDVWINNIKLEEDSAVWIPLRDEFSKKFDRNKAWKFFKTVEGTKYGFPNILNTFMDTTDKNFPPLLDINFAYTLVMLLEQHGIAVVTEIMGESLNARLGTKNLNYAEIAVETAKQNTSFAALMAIPEKEGIDYSIGKSYVCSALATKLWKEAGVFGDLDILPGEFTPKDTYQISLFKDGSDRPDECKKNDPELPFCQLQGSTLMELEGFNSIEMYPNMNEKCGGLPPDYFREPRC